MTVDGHPSFAVGDQQLIVHNCVDQNKDSAYNTREYTHIRINAEKLADTGQPVEALLDFPLSHQKYARTWAGMDVGMCVDEATEILTQRGWLSLDQLSTEDCALAVDETDGRPKWTRVEKVHVFSDSGEGMPQWDMIRLCGEGIDALVTPRHRWLINRAGAWLWRRTLDLQPGDRIPVGAPGALVPELPTGLVDVADLAITIAHHTGRVWCPTLRLGNWLARRNGCTYFTGNTNHPSEILVFGEEETTLRGGRMRDSPSKWLKCLTRVHLERISAPDQRMVMQKIYDFYRPLGFGMDRMQPVSEPVLTPEGWRPIGELAVGDQVIGSDGTPIRVTGVYPQVDRRVMKVTCVDGSWALCGPQHRWTVENSRKGERVTVDTEQLARLIDHPYGRRWYIPLLTGAVSTGEFSAALPLDPYLLGALLGNGNLRDRGHGSMRFATGDRETADRVARALPQGYRLKETRRYNYDIIQEEQRVSRNAKGQFESTSPLIEALHEMGLLGRRSKDKFIPERYLHADPEARLALLQGLMDTDGHVCPQGGKDGRGPSYSLGMNTTSGALANGLIDLVESFGGSGRVRRHDRVRGGWSPVYRVSLSPPRGLRVFRLSRKAAQQFDRRTPLRFVKSVETLDYEEDSVCIRVDAPDELYVTRHHLVTHNTGLGLPIYQEVREQGGPFAKALKGYNFAEKVVVGYETPDDGDFYDADNPMGKPILANVLEFSSDVLRRLVDEQQLLLPWDIELIREFQGQTFVINRSTTDAYGRRVYCVDSQTTVLSKRGWLSYDQLKRGDEIVALNPNTGRQCWSPVRAVNVFDEQERDLLVMENRGHFSVTTLDHRWLVDRYQAHTRRCVDSSWMNSRQILTSRNRMRGIRKGARSESLPTTKKYDDDFVRLVAWYWTEGHEDRGRIVLTQSMEAGRREIEALLRRLLGEPDVEPGRGYKLHGSWTLGKARADGCRSYSIRDRELLRRIVDVCPGREKVVTPEFLIALTQEQLELYIEVSLLADGSLSVQTDRRDGTLTVNKGLSQVSLARAESFRMACVLAGRSISCGQRSDRGATMYRTQILSSDRFWLANVNKRVEKRRCVVWCPTTDHGTFLARRGNGRGNEFMFYTGNSKGTFHALDAARMAALAHFLENIDRLSEVVAGEPVFDSFL